MDRITPKILYRAFNHQDDPSASHLPDATTYGTGRSPREAQPPSQGTEPALGQIEYRGLPVPPTYEELETSGHEPKGGIELYGELRSD